MKKIILILFISFSALIIYQIVLGKNGIIEGYKIKIEKEKLINLKNLLLNRDNELNEYIKYLKSNPDALSYFAHKLGFYDNEAVLIKVIDEVENQDTVSDNYLARKISLVKLIEGIKKDNSKEVKLERIQIGLQIFFYLFFGFFIVLIIIGGQDRNEKNSKQNNRNRNV